MDSLKDQKRSLKISVTQVPYHQIMKDPVDLYNAKVQEVKARNLENAARADLARAQADYKAILPQIQKLLKDAAAARLAGHKKSMLAQAEALQNRIDNRLRQAKKNYERDMSSAIELRERARSAREKLIARAQEAQERIAKLQEAISEMKERHAKLEAKGKALEADKLSIQIQLKIDQMERLQAELEDMKPGARAHIGFNLDRVKLICE